VVGVFIVHNLKSLNKKNYIYGSIGCVKDNVVLVNAFNKNASIDCILTAD